MAVNFCVPKTVRLGGISGGVGRGVAAYAPRDDLRADVESYTEDRLATSESDCVVTANASNRVAIRERRRTSGNKGPSRKSRTAAKVRGEGGGNEGGGGGSEGDCGGDCGGGARGSEVESVAGLAAGLAGIVTGDLGRLLGALTAELRNCLTRQTEAEARASATELRVTEVESRLREAEAQLVDTAARLSRAEDRHLHQLRQHQELRRAMKRLQRQQKEVHEQEQLHQKDREQELATQRWKQQQQQQLPQEQPQPPSVAPTAEAVARAPAATLEASAGYHRGRASLTQQLASCDLADVCAVFDPAQVKAVAGGRSFVAGCGRGAPRVKLPVWSFRRHRRSWSRRELDTSVEASPTVVTPAGNPRAWLSIR